MKRRLLTPTLAMAAMAIFASMNAYSLDKALVKRAQMEGAWGTGCGSPGARIVYDPVGADGKLNYRIVMFPDHVTVKGEVVVLEALGPKKFRFSARSVNVDKPEAGTTTGVTIFDIVEGGRQIIFSEFETGGVKKTAFENGKYVDSGKPVPLQSKCDN